MEKGNCSGTNQKDTVKNHNFENESRNGTNKYSNSYGEIKNCISSNQSHTVNNPNATDSSQIIKGEHRDGIKIDISADPVYGEPQDVFDMVNKYGTYNIQPTSDTHHDYPKIAQGLSKKANEEGKRKKFGQK